ncbi:hypothetical protein D3C87_1866590 [compost metagenome]
MRLVDLHVPAGGLLVVRRERRVVVLVELTGHVVRHVEQRVLGHRHAARGQCQSGQESLEFQRSHVA